MTLLTVFGHADCQKEAEKAGVFGELILFCSFLTSKSKHVFVKKNRLQVEYFLLFFLELTVSKKGV